MCLHESLHVWMCTMLCLVLESEEGIGPPGPVLKGNCGLPSGCWEQSLGPPKSNKCSKLLSHLLGPRRGRVSVIAQAALKLVGTSEASAFLSWTPKTFRPIPLRLARGLSHNILNLSQYYCSGHLKLADEVNFVLQAFRNPNSKWVGEKGVKLNSWICLTTNFTINVTPLSRHLTYWAKISKKTDMK